MIAEERLTHLVVEIIEGVNRSEVVVNDEIQESVEQERDAMGKEVRALIPTVEEPVDGEPVVLSHRDQPSRTDERVHFRPLQLVDIVRAHRVGGEEEMRRVVIELRPLMFAQRVFDGQLVQAEFTRQQHHLRLVRGQEVHPDDGDAVAEMVRDRLEPEPFVDQHALAPGPGGDWTRRHAVTLPVRRAGREPDGTGTR